MLNDHIEFNVMGGRFCVEASNAKDFKICTNELLALHINSAAKFNKVYRENSSKCFLMPAEFKDETMRTFFRSKFEQFRHFSGNDMKEDDAYDKILDNIRDSVQEELDFALENCERQRIELEYLTANGLVDADESKVKTSSLLFQSGRKSNFESQPTTSRITAEHDDSERNNLSDFNAAVERERNWFLDDKKCNVESPDLLHGNPNGIEDVGRNEFSDFNAEVERARNHFVDARQVCIKDWELRNSTQKSLEKLCSIIKQMIGRENVDCNITKEKPNRNKLREQFEHWLNIMRQANEDLEDGLQISQIQSSILLKLEGIGEQFKESKSVIKSKGVVEQDLCEIIDDLLAFSIKLGSHETSLFYERYSVYQSLKSGSYRICCVCGIITLRCENSNGLKDAVAFKALLVVEDGELEEWKALKKDDEDELGILAQFCFHICNMEHDGRHYHILNIDNPSEDSEIEQSCCIVHDGKLTKLSACNECFDRLRKADKFFERADSDYG